MKVRVFRPDSREEEEYVGADYSFEVIPEKGHVLRYTDHEPADLLVDRVGFLQEGDEFIACVWLKDKPMP